MVDQYIYNIKGVGSPLTIGTGGQKIKSVSGVLEVRNNLDNAYARVRGADPVSDNDFVTLRYLRTRGAQITVTGQINGNSPPTPPDGVVYIVTTSGGSFSVNELYYRSGGTWQNIPIVEGQTIVVGTSLVGGTVTFAGDHLYLWDAQSLTWVDVGPVLGASESGHIKSVRSILTPSTAATFNIGTLLVPPGGRVSKAIVNVTAAFNGVGASLSIGDSGNTSSIAIDSEIGLSEVNVYVIDCYVGYGYDTQIIGTFNSAGSTVGNAEIEVFYSLP